MKLDKFINRPVLSTVISILIVILGAIGLATLPITQYPDIAPPTVSVRATYTGASASTVLNSVIAPLEEQINGVENMMYMTSNASNTGSGDISIYFKQGTDPDMAAGIVFNRQLAVPVLKLHLIKLRYAIAHGNSCSRLHKNRNRILQQQLQAGLGIRPA